MNDLVSGNRDTSSNSIFVIIAWLNVPEPLKMMLGIFALFASVSGKTPLEIIGRHNVFEPTTSLQIKIISRKSISKYFFSEKIPEFLLFMTNCHSICIVATWEFVINCLFFMKGRYLLAYSEYETLFLYFYPVNLKFYFEPFH